MSNILAKIKTFFEDKGTVKYLLILTTVLVPFIIYIYIIWQIYIDKFDTPFEDPDGLVAYVNNALTPMVGFLTLGVTIYISFIINNNRAKKEDFKAYLELYQYYSSPEFREKRSVAWKVLKRAIQNEEYANYLFLESCVRRYDKRLSEDEKYNILRNIDDDEYKKYNREELIKKEFEDNHKLDDLINFYKLLAVKNISNYGYQQFDFYYDSWRPLLCWFTVRLEEAYDLHTCNQTYSNIPTLRRTIKLLDKKYYKTKIQKKLSIEETEKYHPIILSMKEEVIARKVKNKNSFYTFSYSVSKNIPFT